MKKMKRLLALVLAMAMALSMAITTSFAAEDGASLSFADAANRTVSTTERQVWEQNGVTLIYDKANYSSDLREYANPLRMYKGTSATVSYSEAMAKIEFFCNTADYATVLANSISDANATVTTTDMMVSVAFAEKVDSFTIESFGAQVRVNSLTVYTSAEGGSEPVVAPEDPADIVKAAYALGVGESLPYTATLTGVISSVDTAYDDYYGNVTVTMVVGDMTEYPIQCYRLKGTGADVIDVGYTITATGTLKNYNGKVEFDANCSLDAYSAPEETPTYDGGSGTESDPYICYGTESLGTSVSVPAGSLVYFNVYGANGMELVVEGEGAYVIHNGETYNAENGSVSLVVTADWMMAPVAIAIGNSSSTDATYSVALNIPLGNFSNPEPVENLWWIEANLEAGDDDGYYYTWTSEYTGYVYMTGTAYDADHNSLDCNVSLYNTNTYAQSNTWTYDKEWNYVLSSPAVVAVSEGDVVMIQACMLADENWQYPAGVIYLSGSCVSGNEYEPVPLSSPNYVAEIGAGASITYSGRFGDMVITISGLDATTTVSHGGTTYTPDANGEVTFNAVTNAWGQSTITITNGADTSTTCFINGSYIEGSYNNPAEITIGENIATEFKQGDSGYYYSWTAEADGVFTVAVDTENTNCGWLLDVNNEYMYSDDEPLVLSKQIEVVAGDVVVIGVATYDPYNGAGTIALNTYFEAKHQCVLTHVPAAEACHANGKQEYWYCTECEAVYADEAGTQLTNHMNLTVLADCELVYMPAVEACHQNGSAEYWFCPECQAVFTDAAGTQLTNRMNLTVLADCELVYMPAVEACHQNGSAEYWFCPECQAVFADAEGRYLTNRMNLTVPADCELVYMPAVEACHQNGSAEYWFCPECQAVFADAEGRYLTNRMNLTVPADCELTYVEAVAATCYENGCAEYWYCEECEAVFADADGRYLTNRMNLTIPAGHDVEHVAESCYNTEFWYCDACESFWADAELVIMTNSKRVIKAVPTHNVEHVAESCYNTEFWYCDACETFWADEALTQITNSKNVIKAEPTHDLKHVEETCECNEYWYCTVCEIFWADEALTQITNSKNVIKAEPTHDYEDGVCTVCGAEEPVEDETPKTGDTAPVMAVIALGLAAAAAFVVLTKKRRA